MSPTAVKLNTHCCRFTGAARGGNEAFSGGQEMPSLSDPNFWSTAPAGIVQSDGSLRYILLDKQYQMMPLIRDRDVTFTDFLDSDSQAKKCDVIVNGNYFDYTYRQAAQARAHITVDPSDVKIQGQVVKGGKIVAGDSRPDSFWFGQRSTFTADPWGWYYVADKGDPPTGPKSPAAIGGVGPLITGDYGFGTSSVNTIKYGVSNVYTAGAPPGAPTVGQPPPDARRYLVQRSSKTIASLETKYPPEAGKTILAYCSYRRMLLVAVQPDGDSPGQNYPTLASNLADRGFDAAVLLDGSTSTTFIVRGTKIVTPSVLKDDLIDVGVGFFK